MTDVIDVAKFFLQVTKVIILFSFYTLFSPLFYSIS